MRLLVLANETCASLAVLEEVKRMVGGVAAPVEVTVVAPTLSRSRMSHWLASDVDEARAKARFRLDQSLDALRGIGVEAIGELGDADPMQALDDFIRVFVPDEVLIATHTSERSAWLERGLVDRARQRWVLPIHHVVVDLDFEREHGVPRPTGDALRAAVRDS